MVYRFSTLSVVPGQCSVWHNSDPGQCSGWLSVFPGQCSVWLSAVPGHCSVWLSAVINLRIVRSTVNPQRIIIKNAPSVLLANIRQPTRILHKSIFRIYDD